MILRATCYAHARFVREQSSAPTGAPSHSTGSAECWTFKGRFLERQKSDKTSLSSAAADCLPCVTPSGAGAPLPAAFQRRSIRPRRPSGAILLEGCIRWLIRRGQSPRSGSKAGSAPWSGSFANVKSKKDTNDALLDPRRSGIVLANHQAGPEFIAVAMASPIPALADCRCLDSPPRGRDFRA